MNKLFHSIKSNALLANSINLMLASSASYAFGFFFWIIVAHKFKSSDVGLATTLLSVSMLISMLGLVGFDTIFIRFLSKARNRNEQITSGLVITGIASAITSGLFLFLIPLFSPKLLFVIQNPLYIACFVVFTVFTTWNNLTNSLFIAYRRSLFVLAINIIFSAAKMCMPLFIYTEGPMTIFIIVGTAQVINVLLSIFALMKFFGYIPSIRVEFSTVREILHFGAAMYLGNIFNLTPDSLLPLIIVNKLGSEQAAYYYIAFSIANLLYTIIYSTTQSLLAEASHLEGNVLIYVHKGVKIISFFLVPSIVFIFIFCPFVLNIFGKNYSSGAVGILRVMSITGLIIMPNAILGFVFKKTKNLKAVMLTSAASAIAIITFSVLLVDKYGLIGIGLASLLGNSIAFMIGVTLIMDKFNMQVEVSNLTRYLIQLLPDKLFIYLNYLYANKKLLNLNQPKTFSEKIQWLKLHGRLENFTQYADKYTVREFIRKTIGEKYLIPLVGIWDTFDDIPIDQLPNKFVIKANHGSGYIFICKDKTSLDKKLLKKTTEKWLNENYYTFHKEAQYKKCKPKLICERYLEDATGGLTDYKFLCFNGEIHHIEVMIDRFTDIAIGYFDIEWNRISMSTPGWENTSKYIAKPEKLEELISIARTLSKKFPFVRVDLYSVNDTVYFGELTFTPGNGLDIYTPDTINYEMGNLTDLSAYSTIPVNE